MHMLYRKFGKTKEMVSSLGFGTMRLPLLNGEQGCSSYGGNQVDEKATAEMLLYGVENGINYIDTAYNYMFGRSEEILGRVLKDMDRQSVYLATKSPIWLLNSPQDFDRILCEQLNRLGTDYIDMYLLHSLNTYDWEEKVLGYGLLDKLRNAKRAGVVRYIGFSFHDELPLFKEIVDAADWDFCQIQLNYVDVNHQAGTKGLQYAASKGLAVSIMEPLRGGLLVSLPQQAGSVLQQDGTDPVEFAFDFLWNMPEVSLVLSGMGNKAQVEHNIRLAGSYASPCFSCSDLEKAARIRGLLKEELQLGCTGCHYCSNGCPVKIPIPEYFDCFREYINGNDDAAKNTYRDIKASGVGSVQDCVGCKSCEGVCPQGIEITKWLKKVDRLLR